MKKIHLLCNAHIDPVWLWRWDDGMAAAISTFRVAADFCEQYEGFVFNHNEAVLYEWVEKHEPSLFERIKKLVKEKKWVIMGGWYLQPDCMMTSGESLINQIELGHSYFYERFGVIPKTAVNVDSFGHSRGLVQILKKMGYDAYLFWRPNHLFSDDFLWEGYDGSQILAHGLFNIYGSIRGIAVEYVKYYWESNENKNTGLCLWGVGNHGGGPSRTDLENLNKFIKDANIEIIHSSVDAYMPEVDRKNLKTIDSSLAPCMVGCYTSMARVKQANRRLENKIAVTEKAMNYAEWSANAIYDRDSLKEAKKALAFCQFHDILPGTIIKAAEDDTLQTLSYGEEIADKLYTQAFFKLCEGQKKVKDGEIPILVFNPHPYEIEGEFEIGFVLEQQNLNDDEITLATVYDEKGDDLLTQNEKPDSTMNRDYPKKICFYGKIKPSSITRFDCKLNTVKINSLQKSIYDSQYICVKNKRMYVRIDRRTGMIDTYEVDGKSYVKNSGILEVYRDNEDPWGMTVDSFTDFEGTFKLMPDDEVSSFIGYPQEVMQNVSVIEDGPVRMKVQAFFSYKRSVAVVEYTLPKLGSEIDIDILLYSNDVNKMIKYRLDTCLSGTPYGEAAFGVEKMFDDERESVFHKWCGIKENDDALFVVNKGFYGGSFTNSTIKLSLLRTPIYAAHPVEEKQVAPHDRLVRHMDMGERGFSFKITTEKNIARTAQIYNEAPRLLSFFPGGTGEEQNSVVTIDNPQVIISSLKKKENGYMMTLYNASHTENDAEITLPKQKKSMKLHFVKYEIKMIEI